MNLNKPNNRKVLRGREGGGLAPDERPIETVDYGLGNKLAKRENIQADLHDVDPEFDEGENVLSEDAKNKLDKILEDITIDPKKNADKSKKLFEEKDNEKMRPDEDAGYRIDKKTKQLQKPEEKESGLEEEDQGGQSDERGNSKK